MDTDAFLATQRVAHLATTSPAGTPHIVPVVYAYDGKRIYIALDDKPKRVPPLRLQRVQNIIFNPRVALLVDRYDEDWGNLAWVRVDGRARVLQRGKTHDLAIATLREKYPQYRVGAFKITPLEKTPIIAITVDKVVAWEAG